MKKNLNNFNFIRFIAASFVICAHSYALIGAYQIAIREVHLGTIGVLIFLMISGYFISKSWEKNPSIGQFFWKRFLRIYPALIGLVIFTIFILGPLVTILTLPEYFSNIDTWTYFRIIILYFQGGITLPGVFETHNYTAVNGSLWVLPLLIDCYVIIVILGKTGILHKKRIILIGTISASIIACVLSFEHIFYTYLPYYIFFFIGVLFNLYQDKIKYEFRIFLCIIIIEVIAFFLNSLLFYYAFLIGLPYLIFYLGFLPSKRLSNFGKNRDISYGIYIFGWPIHQTIIHIFNKNITGELIFFLSMSIVIPLALLSWWLIESRTLKYKNYKFHLKIRSKKNSKNLQNKQT